MRGNEIISTCYTVIVIALLVIFAHVRISTHVTFVFVTCHLVLVRTSTSPIETVVDASKVMATMQYSQKLR